MGSRPGLVRVLHIQHSKICVRDYVYLVAHERCLAGAAHRARTDTQTRPSFPLFPRPAPLFFYVSLCPSASSLLPPVGLLLAVHYRPGLTLPAADSPQRSLAQPSIPVWPDTTSATPACLREYAESSEAGVDCDVYGWAPLANGFLAGRWSCVRSHAVCAPQQWLLFIREPAILAVLAGMEGEGLVGRQAEGARTQAYR